MDGSSQDSCSQLSFSSSHLLLPFQRRAPWRSNSIISAAERCTTCLLLLGRRAQQLSWAVTGSPSYTSVPGQGARAALQRKLCHHLGANPGRIHTGGAASLSHHGCWVLWVLSSAAAAHLQTSAHGHRASASLQHRRGQGTATRAVPAQSSAPSHLCFPLGHLSAGKEGEQGKSHSTLLAIREEIQLSAAFQLPSQQPDTSEVWADSVCCHPVPWLSPAPPGAFP